MKAFRDIAGERFGALVAIRCLPARNNQTFWLFRCDCGTEKAIRSAHVTGGKTSTCGCRSNLGHGLSDTRIWQTWKAMKQRCNNRHGIAFHRYGGRGISYTPEWETFEPFRDWALANGYEDDLEIDRINNDGNYEPTNCRFVSHKENGRNTSRTTIVEFEGDLISLPALAEKLGLRHHTLACRIARGWTLAEAVLPTFSRGGARRTGPGSRKPFKHKQPRRGSKARALLDAMPPSSTS